MKKSTKIMIIVSLVVIIGCSIGYYFWNKNRKIKFYYRHFEIDSMTTDELKGAVLDTGGYSWDFNDDTRSANRDGLEGVSDETLRQELRNNMSDMMKAAYSGN